MVKRIICFLKRNYFAVLLFLMISVIVIFVFVFSVSDKIKTKSYSDSETYSFREYNNRIGIFKDGESFPYELLDVNVAILPESDCEKLQIGITVSGIDEVRSLIEDFTG